MTITLHQIHHKVADFNNIIKYLEGIKEAGVHVFPELSLTGYPLQDLCLQKSFIDAYQNLLKSVEKLAKKLKKDQVFLLGGLKYELGKDGVPIDITNVIYKLDNDGLKDIYTKQLLPNYDIFDEQKYFTAGKEAAIWEFDGEQYGLLICEDMWASSFHHKDPIKDLQKLVKKEKADLKAVINLSASPYSVGKFEKRLERAKYISRAFKAPYVYVNRVGGEDEILFDGQSFVCDGNNILTKAKRFQEDLISWDRNEDFDFKGSTKEEKENTWESLFSARLSNDGDLPLVTSWDDDQCQEILEALSFGFQDYAAKCGFQNFTVALSGGMDSALVLTIMRLALKEGQYMEAIYMPSIHSSPLSYELSAKLCQNLGIPLTSLPIKFLHSTTKNLFGQSFSQPFEGLTDENIQSRLRGTLLYTRSNQINSMVVNTSNKSELAVGYSTQYGDSVGAISMLGDLYKSEVYHLAHFINKKNKGIIPEGIIERPPTAELRPDQVDTETLPPYDRLDAILEGILSYRLSRKDLVDKGFDEEEVNKVFHLYRRNEYKRYQFCPIIKISSKSFGFGYRIPISKASDFYLK